MMSRIKQLSFDTSHVPGRPVSLAKALAAIGMGFATSLKTSRKLDESEVAVAFSLQVR
jgi:hypothetical protein